MLFVPRPKNIALIAMYGTDYFNLSQTKDSQNVF